MRLYATALSSFSLKVRLAAAWKGIALEIAAPPGGYRSAEYRALVPTGTVPALELPGLILSESDAIIEYLEEAFPGPALLPANPTGRALARMMARLHDFRIDPPLRAMFADVRTELPELERIAAGVERFRQGLSVVEAMRPAGRYMAGGQFTLADCAFAGSLLIAERMLPRLGADAPLPGWVGDWLAVLRSEAALAALVRDYEDSVSAWLG